MTHTAAYFDGQGDGREHPGSIWDCTESRCAQWVDRVEREGLWAATHPTERDLIGKPSKGD